MKNIKKIKLITLFFIIIFSSLIYASKKKVEEIDEKKAFYSEYKESVNINNGVKVVIVKSDKYGDFQDEYVSVDVKVENINRYATLNYEIEAIPPDLWTIKDSKKSGYLTSSEIEEFSFDYKYGKPKRLFKEEIDKLNLDRDISFGDKYERSTNSNAYEVYYRDKDNKATESDIKEEDENISKKYIYILALIIIAIIFLFIMIYFIRRYLRGREEFYSIFFIITISLSIILGLIFKTVKTYAYTQQTFLVNTEYSNTYTATVWSGGKDYTFRFIVKYKFIRDIPIYDENQDSDNDGLSDNYEIYFMTDIYDIDTDNDGISDYDEIYIINTNPLSIDTENTGIKDCDRDYDKDGLTNIEEKNLNTFMDSKDTDSDGLTDYEEVKIYNTNPILYDTDSDSLSDYEEVEVMKKMGLSDISSIDKSVKYEQELSLDNIDKKLYMDNVIKISVSGDVYGLIDKHIKVKDRTNATFKNMSSILGRVAYIDNDYETSNIKVTYDISNYSLKREALKICIYEDGKVKMLDTTLSDNKITANINSGFVFVVDISRYIDDILAYKKDNLK